VTTHDDFWSRTNAVRWSDSKPLENDETYQADNIDIKTQAGLEMFKYFNDNYGSSVWGKVLEGIKAIEEELS
jgi:hypothetical protein